MKHTRLLLIISLIALTSGYSADSNSDGDESVSVTEDSRTLKKISHSMIKDYLRAVGCKKRSTKEFVKRIKDETEQTDEYVSEHWKLKACGKTRNIKIDFHKDGSRVFIEQYRP